MSKKIRSCFSLRGLYVALCLSAFLLVVETQAQAQSALTRHVRQAVTGGQAQLLNLLPATQSLRLDVVLPLAQSGRLG